MKKLAFVVGLGIGFILGSRVGSGPYQALEEKAKALRAQPEVEEVVERAKEAASDKAAHAVDKVNEKLPPPAAPTREVRV